MMPADNPLVLIVSVEVAGPPPSVTEAGERLQGSVGTTWPDTEQVSEMAVERLPWAVMVRTSLATEPFRTDRFALAGLSVKSAVLTGTVITTSELPIRFEGSFLILKIMKKSLAA